VTPGNALTSFATAAGILGALLIAGALLSGLAGRSVLSLTAVFVVAGFILGHGGFGALQIAPRSTFVADLADVALIVILFRDGLEVDAGFLRRDWHVPVRKLVIAMPITAVVVALVARLVLGLGWTESFLLGALLSPTDPVLSSGVVTDARVPALIRHSLNVESGLNDGLALPAVLAFAAALEVSSTQFHWWRFVAQDVLLGFAYGLVCGLIAAAVFNWAGARGRAILAEHQRSLYGLGVAFATYAVTFLGPHGNGLIAVFVAAIVLGIRAPRLGEDFSERSGELVEIVKLGVFVVFGSLLTLDGLFGDGWGAVAVVFATLLIARPLAVFLALAGSEIDRSSIAFMAWFGPKGVATMTFSLLILSEPIVAGPRLFNIAALAVIVSIVLHGATDTLAVRWFARRSPGVPTAG
jgi:NhaP-type Na+/H+ or K+/H+ antiporter